MTKDDVPRLRAALQAQFPGVEVVTRITDWGTGLTVATRAGDARRAWRSPDTMDYKALSMEEWLYRFTLALSEKHQWSPPSSS